MSETSPIIPWLIWVTPVIGAVLTPFFARVGQRVRDYTAVGFSLASALLAALLLPLALAGETIHHTLPWIPTLKINAGVLADPLAVFMSNIVAWISFLIMLYSIGYMHGEKNLTRYWFFMNFFIGNMQLIVLSDNFLQLFFGWEGVGLCSYALIGFWHSDEEKYWVGTPGHKAAGLEQAYSPSHAGMKAFIATRIGDVAFLIGLLVLYAYTGTFSFKEMASNTSWAKDMATAGLLIPSAVLIFGGAVGKSAQFPLQEWLPDAMAGPTAVSALIHAATMVKAGVFLVARFGPIFYIAATSAEIIAPLFTTIAWIGAFTAFLAATQALVGREIKKVLAYSTVSQIGYMMLALGVAGLAADFTQGFTAGFFHLTSHALFKASMFMAAGALIHATGTKYLHEMGNIRKEMKITFAAMILAAASLAGVPPLSGFWSKDSILSSILSVEGYALTPLLYALAAGTAIITVFYSFRMVGLTFFGAKSHHLESQEKEGHHVHEAPRVMWIPYVVLAVATLAVGVIGQSFEGALHKIFGESLVTEFHLKTHGAEAATLNFTAVTTSLLAVAIGGFLAYQFYFARRWSAEQVIASNSALRGLHKFLYNRWYLNSFYYWVLVRSTMRFSKEAFRYLETGVIDRLNDASSSGTRVFSSLSDSFDSYVVDGAVNGLAYLNVQFSRVSRSVQSGLTQQYVVVFASGIVAVVAIMILRYLLGG